MKSTKIQVAFAEDNKEDIEMIKDAFKSLPQYEIVIAATCGKKLIKELGKLKQLPHLILMDMQMPNCDGLTATIVCKHIYKNVKIVGLSSHTYESVICEFMAEGGNGFLSKSILKPNSIVDLHTYKQSDV
jgi:DNA-binding NarL/FixJ family response regulator